MAGNSTGAWTRWFIGLLIPVLLAVSGGLYAIKADKATVEAALEKKIDRGEITPRFDALDKSMKELIELHPRQK